MVVHNQVHRNGVGVNGAGIHKDILCVRVAHHAVDEFLSGIFERFDLGGTRGRKSVHRVGHVEDKRYLKVTETLTCSPGGKGRHAGPTKEFQEIGFDTCCGSGTDRFGKVVLDNCDPAFVEVLIQTGAFEIVYNHFFGV